MGLVNGQVAAYGRGEEAQDGIDGLELLEEHWAAQRKEANGGVSDDEVDVDEDDEAGWDNWDVQSDAESDSSGWEEVSSGDEDFNISDSEDEDSKKKEKATKKEKRTRDKKDRKRKRGGDEESEEEDDDDAKSVVSAATTAASEGKKISLIAQQKILTPADFALLNELRLKAAKEAAESGGGSAARRKVAQLEAEKRTTNKDEQSRFLTEDEILGPRKRAKQNYEERMESIRKGRDGREKFGSMKGKANKENPSSSTNREKTRNKPIMMALQCVFRRSIFCIYANASQLQPCREQEEGFAPRQADSSPCVYRQAEEDEALDRYSSVSSRVLVCIMVCFWFRLLDQITERSTECGCFVPCAYCCHGSPLRQLPATLNGCC
jgi:protein SDA1